MRALIAEYEGALPPGAWPNWVLGNHDRPRSATKRGPAQARVAQMLLLTLRGTPTLYYGDELGLEDVAIPAERGSAPVTRRIGADDGYFNDLSTRWSLMLNEARARLGPPFAALRLALLAVGFKRNKLLIIEDITPSRYFRPRRRCNAAPAASGLLLLNSASARRERVLSELRGKLAWGGRRRRLRRRCARARRPAAAGKHRARRSEQVFDHAHKFAHAAHAGGEQRCACT